MHRKTRASWYSLRVRKREARTAKPAESFPELLVRLLKGSPFRTMAALARAAGVQPSTLSRWLSGATTPDPVTLERVARVLEVDPVSLFRVVYPDQPVPAVIRRGGAPVLDPLVADLQAVLTSPDIDPADRESVRTLVEHVIRPYIRANREAS